MLEVISRKITAVEDEMERLRQVQRELQRLREVAASLAHGQQQAAFQLAPFALLRGLAVEDRLKCDLRAVFLSPVCSFSMAESQPVVARHHRPGPASGAAGP